MATEPVYDLMGNHVQAGDRVVWPTRMGSALCLNVGEVLTIKFDVLDRWPAPELGHLKIRVKREDGGQVVVLTRPDRLLILEGTHGKDRPDPDRGVLEPKDQEGGVRDRPGREAAGADEEE